MIVAYDEEIPPLREHPWTVSMAVPDGRYWDFKAHPEQIPLVLEDFRPWAHYAAIPRFYELLAWLNGFDSILESNDCGLRPPRVDEGAPEMVRGFVYRRSDRGARPADGSLPRSGVERGRSHGGRLQAVDP